MLPRPGPAPLGAVPQNGSEALAAARAMQERARLLQRISAEHLRHLARPFWLAGWRPADVLHAIDHEPGGRQHGYTAGVRSPAAWIRARLAAWLSPDGTPLPSPGQQRAAAAARARADADARREEAARLEAAAPPTPPAGPAGARAMLAARGGTVARDLARWQAPARRHRRQADISVRPGSVTPAAPGPPQASPAASGPGPAGGPGRRGQARAAPTSPGGSRSADPRAPDVAGGGRLLTAAAEATAGR